MVNASAFIKRHSQNRAVLAAVVALFTLFNLLSDADTASVLSRFHRRQANAQQEGGIPEVWPVEGLRNAALTPEESVHYRLETAAGAAEWASALPRGRGVVHVDGRPFRLAMFHQLECLGVVRAEVMARAHDPATPPGARAHFCLNYLRESIVCAADAHLEMVRSEYGGRAVLPYTTRTDCADWEQVWGAAEENFDEWAREELDARPELLV
ncbi:hypothetical protein DFH11DRAFT_1630742 [Phellopilus nigrolimitatus]|nr:hypothetical protein DFH11DRAFT_1630742 [Phellopilus nigrolimitatus]